jgi:hypothetical protein
MTNVLCPRAAWDLHWESGKTAQKFEFGLILPPAHHWLKPRLRQGFSQ